MASSTAWGASVTAEDADPLHRIATTAVAEHVALRRRLHALPSGSWRPTAAIAALDAAVTLAVLTAGTRVAGAEVGLGMLVVLGVTWCAALLGRTPGPRTLSALGAADLTRAVSLTGLACFVADAVLTPTTAPGPVLGLLAALGVAALITRTGLLLHRRSLAPTRVAIAGDAADVGRVVAELRRDRRPRYEVSSICLDVDDPDAIEAGLIASVPVWAGAEKLVDAAAATGAGAVLIAPGRALPPEEARRVSWAAHRAGLEVLVDTGLHDVHPTRAQLLSTGALGLVRVQPTTLPSPARLAKDVADRVLALILLVVLLPLLCCVALLVRLDSPGRVLFRQERTGRDGSPFTMYKFRTMHEGAAAQVEALEDCNESDGVLFKIRADPRITRVGAVLRRYSLDELPQLLNVLFGEMSLVGPRPALPGEVARYDHDPRHRLVVKPGLTGLWQVSGRSDLSWEESVRLDLHYVDNWSLGLDARILARTAQAVLGHRGAY